MNKSGSREKSTVYLPPPLYKKTYHVTRSCECLLIQMCACHEGARVSSYTNPVQAGVAEPRTGESPPGGLRDLVQPARTLI